MQAYRIGCLLRENIAQSLGDAAERVDYKVEGFAPTSRAAHKLAEFME